MFDFVFIIDGDEGYFLWYISFFMVFFSLWLYCVKIIGFMVELVNIRYRKRCMIEDGICDLNLFIVNIVKNGI